MRSQWSGHYPAVVKDSWPVSFLLLHGLARKPRRTRRGSAQLATRTVSVPTESTEPWRKPAVKIANGLDCSDKAVAHLGE